MVDVSFSLLTFEYFLLILVRIASFVSVAPFFSMSNTPGRVKAGFSFFVAVIVFSILPKTPVEYASMFGYSILVLKEVATGLLIGMAANICNNIVLVAGHLIDVNTGLSMATEFDPITQTESAITGNMYNHFVLLLLIVTNMQHYILRAIVDSYQLIPVNGQNFEWNQILSTMITFMTDIFVLAFRISLPVFACIMILNCVLGIMAKVAPQMNMFAVGMQLKILLGFLILLLTIGLLPYISDFVFTEMKKIMVSMIEGMY